MKSKAGNDDENGNTNFLSKICTKSLKNDPGSDFVLSIVVFGDLSQSLDPWIYVRFTAIFLICFAI